jgi:S1-C subfamily serine protease
MLATLPFLLATMTLPSTCNPLKSHSNENSPTTPLTLADRIEQARTAVVKINASEVSGNFQVHSSGTGFIVNSDGYVVTALHVVKPPQFSEPLKNIEIAIAMLAYHDQNGNRYAANFSAVGATLVAKDELHDIAVLRPNANFMDKTYRTGMDRASDGVPLTPILKAATFDHFIVRDGDPIFIPGYPLDYPILITTSGTVAASAPTGNDDAYWVDIHANHGNSGGPAFSTTTGNVIGIQSRIKLADAEFGGPFEAPKFDLHDPATGTTLRNPATGKVFQDTLKYNAGLTYLTRAEYIGALLTLNHIAFSR